MPSTNAHCGVVEFILGGGLCAMRLASKADALVLIDGHEEVAQVPDLPHLIKVPLGEQDTVLSMLKRLQKRQAEEWTGLLEDYSHQRSNVYLGRGMAQDPRIGTAVIWDLHFQDALTPLFDEIFDRVMKAVNGQLDTLIIRVAISVAGGMGAGGGPEISQFFCRYALEQRNDTPMLCHFVCSGGLTYTGVAPKARANAGQQTRKILEQIYDSERPTMVTFALELYELPLRGEEDKARGQDNAMDIDKNRDLRDSLAGLLMQARFASAVETELNRSELNDTSHFGGILRAQARWSERWDPKQLLWAVASTYREQLKALRQSDTAASDMRGLYRVDVELEAQGTALPALDDIMQLLRTGEVSSDVDDYIKAPLQSFRVTEELVYTSPEHPVSLRAFLGPAVRPPTFENFQERHIRLLQTQAHLKAALALAQQARDQAEKAFEATQRAARQALGSLRSPVQRLVHSATTLLKKAQKQLADCHKAHALYSLTRARHEAYAVALARVAADRTDYEAKWLTPLERYLGTIVATRTEALNPALFACKPIGDVFKELLDVALHGTPGEDNQMGLRDPGYVTFAGLAELLKLPATTDAGAIVKALAADRWSFESPLWGGSRAQATPRYQCIVVPPMAPGDFNELQRLAAEHGLSPKVQLVMADTMTAGCCLVKLVFYPVTKCEQILPPLYCSNGTSIGPSHYDAGPSAHGNGVPATPPQPPVDPTVRPGVNSSTSNDHTSTSNA